MTTPITTTRIVDATTYFLQARAFAESGFTFPVPEPSASFRGRFLLWDEARGASGLFPPGWPIVLSLGFRLGAPMVVGPALAEGHSGTRSHLYHPGFRHEYRAADPNARRDLRAHGAGAVHTQESEA